MPTWLESGFVWSFIKIDPKFGELIRENTRNTLNENREWNTELVQVIDKIFSSLGAEFTALVRHHDR